MLVYTTGHGVNGFTYEPTLGEYFLSHPHLQMPVDGKIYSVNEGSANSFAKPMTQYVQHCKDSKYTARYIGSLVADFHRNMLKGGIYIYPATAKDPKENFVLSMNATHWLLSPNKPEDQPPMVRNASSTFNQHNYISAHHSMLDRRTWWRRRCLFRTASEE